MIKVIHLGDLHLGIKFHKRNLIPDQRYALTQIVNLAEHNQAHVIISGDIFDTVNPSIEAQELWFDFLERLGEANQRNECHTFIISGNHDSAARLSLARTFMKTSNIHIVDKDSPYEVFSLLEGIKLICVPFTKPSTLESHFKIVTDSYDDAYKELLKIIKKDTLIDDKTVLVAHQTFEGGRTGESEFKPFMTDAVSLNTVKEFPVVLAGHLHAYQNLDNVHYSGSLLPYAFGDDYSQSISIWTYDENASTKKWHHRRVSVDILHPLKVIEGDLSHCLNQDPGDFYVKVKLVNCLHFEEALAKLQERFPLLLLVVSDSADRWVADLDKPVNTFGTVEEAINAFCDHLEVPRFSGRKQELIQEALDAFTQTEN